MMARDIFNIFATFGFINMCVNPFIYASRYDVFKQSVKKLMQKEHTIAPAATNTTR